MINIGDKVLVTTDGWFFAPDGEQYRSVFGTVKGIHSSENTLGVKTNAKSTNWYAEVGNMIIAGCQIHYCIKTDKVSFDPPIGEMVHEGKICTDNQSNTSIYNADKNV